MNSWTINVDRPDEFEFTELDANLPGTWAPEQPVAYSLGGSLAFAGWIFSRHPSGAGQGSITVGYHCYSLKYAAYLIPITASDGTGTMAFNLPTTDPNYAPTEAGLSVGTMLYQVFTQNAAQLAAVGISADSTTEAQLAVLTVVPPDPTYIQGSSLWAQVDQLMQQWYGSRYAVTVLPTGFIRLIDTYSLTQQTLTFGQDAIILNSMQEDTSECYTQVIVRGRDNVVPATCSLSNGDLVDPNVVSEETWNINDYLYPIGGYDTGNITLVNSTQVTIQSDSATETWPVNYWSNLSAQIAIIDPLSTLVTGYEYRHITANTALVAGGTSVITLDSAIGSVAYTRYQIRGQNVGQSNCYRQYTLTNTYVAEHLQQYFPYAVNYGNNQWFEAQTNYPISTITINNNGLPWQFSLPFQIIPYNGTTPGYILFQSPIVMQWNSQQALTQGGSAVQKPTDVCVFIPYSTGALTVQSPSAGGYSGTAFTLFGVQRTLYRDYPSWIDPRQASAIQMLSDAILATVSQALQEGQVTYYGQYLPALTPGSPISLSLAQFSGNPIKSTTGYESMQAPCRSVTLEWPQQGGSQWITRLSFSTRRQAYSGDRLYLHANYQQGGGWFSSLGGFEGASFASNATAALTGSVNPASFSAGQASGPSGADFSAGLGSAANNYGNVSGAGFNAIGSEQPQMPEAPNPGGFTPLTGDEGMD